MAKSTADRFWSKVEHGESGCLLWTAHRNHNGYGTFSAGGRSVLAHRWSYVAVKGAILDGLQLDHLCRVRHCVNPHHLEAVTPRTNSLRGQGPAARRAFAEKCESGHALAGRNLYVDPSGYRRCRACAARWQREAKARQRERAGA